MWSPVHLHVSLALWSHQQICLLHNACSVCHLSLAEMSPMEIRCKVLKMKSRVAPEGALELSEVGLACFPEGSCVTQ